MSIIGYNRDAAVEYARRWAFGRNPRYYDFSRIGGDCTNFASQCLFAGVGVMNFTPDIGWYYRSENDRAAAWTGVEYFYRFLTQNAVSPIGTGAGPFAEEQPIDGLQIGDFVQFGRSTGDFYHTPMIVGFANGQPLVAAHSNDAFARPLASYRFEKIRGIRIVAARKE